MLIAGYRTWMPLSFSCWTRCQNTSATNEYLCQYLWYLSPYGVRSSAAQIEIRNEISYCLNAYQLVHTKRNIIFSWERASLTLHAFSEFLGIFLMIYILQPPKNELASDLSRSCMKPFHYSLNNFNCFTTKHVCKACRGIELLDLKTKFCTSDTDKDIKKKHALSLKETR